LLTPTPAAATETCKVPAHHDRRQLLSLPRYGPENPEVTYVPHAYEEHLADLGEVQMNYASAGSPEKPALLLIPGQTESWWGYEAAMKLLESDFQLFAVDLRGQGRSSRTPGRYTWDNFGNDLVRFIDIVIQRPTFVAGLSSGGVLSAWLSAYAKPGQVRAAYYEDPPLFASETQPAVGPSIRQGMAGPMFALWSKYLGDQWSIGDWEGMGRASANQLPGARPANPAPASTAGAVPEPPQNLKEYDPEWGRAFWSGSVSAGCDHETMLRSVKVPVLFSHHMRKELPDGRLLGALSDVQLARVRTLVGGAGQQFTYVSFPEMPHSMHGADPELYAKTVRDWVRTLGV
jgi:pimeloyl-ACP methyl ester carboxylesterase